MDGPRFVAVDEELFPPLTGHMTDVVDGRASLWISAANLEDTRQPRTVATAIKIGNPASWGPALEAMKDSRGWIDIVTDEEILRAYRLLAREEGIFMEAASAATVAGLIKLAKAGRFEPGSTLVLTLTGHGLKDPDTALESASRPTAVPPRVDAVLAQLGL